jgi:hypothetical protein
LCTRRNSSIGYNILESGVSLTSEMSSLKHAAPIQRQVADDKIRLLFIFGEWFEQVPEAILLLDNASRAVRTGGATGLFH